MIDYATLIRDSAAEDIKQNAATPLIKVADYWLGGTASSASGSQKGENEGDLGIESPFNESISIVTARGDAMMNTERNENDGGGPKMVDANAA